MNRDRRKRLGKLLDKLIDLKTELAEICDEEQEAYDCMPESLQESEKGMKVDEGICSLQEAVSSFDEIEINIQSAIE